jgi:hypothetical protein
MTEQPAASPPPAAAAAGVPPTLAQLKVMHPPVKGKAAGIPAALWDQYLYAAAELADRQAMLDMAEAEIREVAGDAQVLTVGGAKVAVRIRQHVTGASWVKDFYRRTPRKDKSQ